MAEIWAPAFLPEISLFVYLEISAAVLLMLRRNYNHQWFSWI